MRLSCPARVREASRRRGWMRRRRNACVRDVQDCAVFGGAEGREDGTDFDGVAFAHEQRARRKRNSG